MDKALCSSRETIDWFTKLIQSIGSDKQDFKMLKILEIVYHFSHVFWHE